MFFTFYFLKATLRSQSTKCKCSSKDGCMKMLVRDSVEVVDEDGDTNMMVRNKVRRQLDRTFGFYMASLLLIWWGL